MCCFSFSCEVFPESKLITIHGFKQILIFFYSASLPSFYFFCLISLPSLSVCFVFLCSFYSKLAYSQHIYSPRETFKWLVVCSPLHSRAADGNKRRACGHFLLSLISRELHCDELTEDCKKHRDERIQRYGLLF